MKQTLYALTFLASTAPHVLADNHLYQYDFGIDQNFDTAVFTGTDLPATSDTSGLTIGENVKFPERLDVVTGLEAKGGSTVLYWGSHTGFKGTKTFTLTSEQLTAGSSILFELEVANWFPSRPDTSRPDTYTMRKFKAKILLDGREIGELKGESPAEDQLSSFTLTRSADELKAGTYELVFTVEKGGNYGAIDTFTVTKAP